MQQQILAFATKESCPALQNLALEKSIPSSSSKLYLPLTRVGDTVEEKKASQKSTKGYSKLVHTIYLIYRITN